MDQKITRDMLTIPGMLTDSPSKGPRRTVAFLATSPDIYAEALPYLYKRNRFTFDSYLTLKYFLVMIGDSIEMLRHVSTSGRLSNGAAEMCFALLTRAKKLKYLEVAAEHSKLSRKNVDAFRLLSPIILSLGKELHDMYGALHIIHFNHSGATEAEKELFLIRFQVRMQETLRPRVRIHQTAKAAFMKALV